MNPVYSILVSDGALVLHFLLTMALLAAVILCGIHWDLKLRRVVSENTDLRRQLNELSVLDSNSAHDMQRTMDRHREAICHTADYLLGASDLDVTRFNKLDSESPRANTGSAAFSELYAVDQVQDDVPGPDLSMAESAFIEPVPGYSEPDVSLPMKASMITMPVHDERLDAADDTSRNRADLMTRVLQQSRGQ